MAKFSFSYVKSNPVMFGAIIIVFGLFLWLFLNRGSSGGGSTQLVASGPSDAQVAAGMQMQIAGMGYAAQAGQTAAQLQATMAANESAERLAGLELSYRVAELAATERVGMATIESSLAALSIQTDAQVGVAIANNQFMVDYARVAADSATTQLLINASLQRDLGAQQLEAFKVGSILATTASMKKKDVDNFMHAYIGSTVIPTRAGGGGGFGIGDVFKAIASPAVAVVGALTKSSGNGTGGQFQRAG